MKEYLREGCELPGCLGKVMEELGYGDFWDWCDMKMGILWREWCVDNPREVVAVLMEFDEVREMVKSTGGWMSESMMAFAVKKFFEVSMKRALRLVDRAVGLRMVEKRLTKKGLYLKVDENGLVMKKDGEMGMTRGMLKVEDMPWIEDLFPDEYKG